MKHMIVDESGLSKRGQRKVEPFKTRDDRVWPVVVEEGYAKRKRRLPLLDIPRWGAMVLTDASRADWDSVRKTALIVGKRTGMKFATLYHEDFEAVEIVRQW